MISDHTELLRRNAAFHGRECPFCGERVGIEWNGQNGAHRVFACHGGNGCREQWDANDYQLSDTELETLDASR